MVLVLIFEFSKLPLATAIMVLTSVSCYYMTSFHYGGKKTRDVGFTCRHHLSNIMPDIFYDSMEWGITCLFYILIIIIIILRVIANGFSCIIIITSMGLGKP